MAMWINTNAGAMIALQSLSATNRFLETTQMRVTTGLRVGGPKDDAATFAIAQNMRGDIAGMGAVKTNLALGQSIVNVAIDACKAIADLLTEMKAKAVQASQEGLDDDSYTALHQEFTSLRAQIESIVATAEFNGKNLIDSAATDLKVLSTVDGSTITVTAQSIDSTTLAIHTASLADAIVAATALTAISQAIIDVSNALASLGSGADAILADLQEGEPDSLLYAIYRARIETFRLAPPGAAWDGTFTQPAP
ncbi:MAG: flagellin [Alphaproteobacteria bacterium]|nr:flagellin [Alphaproteobacteria bacterium]